MSKRRYGKLVRDNVPDMIRADGDIPNVRTMDIDEFRKELLYKLVEEAEELRRAGEYNGGNLESLEEESSDVLEVLYAIFKEFELDEGGIEKQRRIKLNKKGAFENKIFLESVISNQNQD